MSEHNFQGTKNLRSVSRDVRLQLRPLNEDVDNIPTEGEEEW